MTFYVNGPIMNASDVSALARHLVEAHGTKAMAEAARKAASFEKSGDKEQAKVWRQVEAVIAELRGPRDS